MWRRSSSNSARVMSPLCLSLSLALFLPFLSGFALLCFAVY